MAQKPPIGEVAKPVTDEALRVRVEIDLDEFYQRLVSRTREVLPDLQQQGLTGDELARRLEAELSNLSDTPIEQMGRGSTSEAFNLGRNEAAQELQPQIGRVVRTEILDENTCEPCQSLDGRVVEMNSPDYFEFMPPNFCQGESFCRGFYIYRSAA
jgi:hypothetical protein